MSKNFDTKTIGLIGMFENVTRAEARDCIQNDNCIYFLVNRGKVGLVIGKNGKNIKRLNKLIKKQIKIFEYNEDPKVFIKNMIPEIQFIEIKDQRAVVSIKKSEKGKVIGRSGSKVKIIRELLERNSIVKKLDIK